MTVETAPAQRLAEIVAHLANEIGPRNIHYYTALRSAAGRRGNKVLAYLRIAARTLLSSGILSNLSL